MDSIVCIKVVPDENEEIHLGKDGQPALSNVEKVGSAFDRCALELAVREKEKNGGCVTAVSMGEDTCKGILRNCIAVGADRGAWICSEKSKEMDAAENARTLADAVRAAEQAQGKPFDVIYCGIESTDLGNGVFGPALAEYLERPCAVNIKEIEWDGDGIRVKKETETGYEVLKVNFPAVIMVTKTEFNPRYPTLKSKMAARKAEITEWKTDKQQCENLQIDYGESPKKSAGIILNSDPENAVKEAVKLMKTRI